MEATAYAPFDEPLTVRKVLWRNIRCHVYRYRCGRDHARCRNRTRPGACSSGEQFGQRVNPWMALWSGTSLIGNWKL